MRRLLFIFCLAFVSARAFGKICYEDERTKPARGFFASFLNYFEKTASPQELAEFDRVQARVHKEDVLYYIAHDKCLARKRAGQDSGQCHVVDEARGCAVLKDIKEDHHFLGIPLGTVVGIEDPALLKPHGPNYWDCAWAHRNVIGESPSVTYRRDDIALAINSRDARALNQLHIHMGCVRAETKEFLRKSESAIGHQWTTIGDEHQGNLRRYLKLNQESLEGFDPFHALADDLIAQGKNPSEMEDHALTVIGTTFSNDQPGFYIIDDYADPRATDGGASAEHLYMHACP